MLPLLVKRNITYIVLFLYLPCKGVHIKLLFMTDKKIADLSDKELLQQMNKLRNGKIIDSLIIGFSMGVVVYSAVNGFNIFTLSPFLIVYLIVKNSKNNKILEGEIKKEMESRRLTKKI